MKICCDNCGKWFDDLVRYEMCPHDVMNFLPVPVTEQKELQPQPVSATADIQESPRTVTLPAVIWFEPLQRKPVEIFCDDFVAWAALESERIKSGESLLYHAVFCDPPYGISFMGKAWDDQRSAFQKDVTKWGKAILPLLYPGALVFMFGGTRTWHRLAAGMEDAGFELWDTIMWLHGQGFPKAQAIDALIDKKNGDKREVVGKSQWASSASNTRDLYGGYTSEDTRNVTAAGSDQSAPWSGHKTAALKPAWEPVLCFKAPNGGKTYAELAIEFGSGALNVDGGRIGTQGGYETVIPAPKGSEGKIFGSGISGHRTADANTGRYPANLAFECICETVETVETVETFKAPEDTGAPNYLNQVYGRGKGGGVWTGKRKGTAIRHTNPDCPAFLLDEQAGEHPGCSSPSNAKPESIYRPTQGGYQAQGPIYPGTGGPSRFFYCAKASRSEREAGLETFATNRRDLSRNAEQPSMNGGEGNPFNRGAVQVRNDHPCVKPIKLTEWLATLLLPAKTGTKRRLLIPFSGSGSEAIGAKLAGWDEIVCVEKDEHYVEIATARLAKYSQDEEEAA